MNDPIVNEGPPYERILRAAQARAILDVLMKELSSNSQVIASWLAALGIPATAQSLTDLVDRLEAEGLVSVRQVGDVKVLQLREAGGEVAAGIQTRDWIARPALPK